MESLRNQKYYVESESLNSHPTTILSDSKELRWLWTRHSILSEHSWFPHGSGGWNQ